jgi:hypothetical protein
MIGQIGGRFFDCARSDRARGPGVLNLSQTATCLTPQVVASPLNVVTCRAAGDAEAG